jgi:hypothetical protein
MNCERAFRVACAAPGYDDGYLKKTIVNNSWINSNHSHTYQTLLQYVAQLESRMKVSFHNSIVFGNEF